MGQLAPEPTQHLPGTKEKIQIMRERAAMGYCLFHPLDATHASMSNVLPDIMLLAIKNRARECDYE